MDGFDSPRGISIKCLSKVYKLLSSRPSGSSSETLEK
jgi:hypothetical protein